MPEPLIPSFPGQMLVSSTVVSTFPSAGLIDDFNRGSLGANWSSDIGAGGGGIIGTINSNAFTVTGGAAGSAWWNATTFGNDHEIYCTVSTIASGSIFLYARGANFGTINARGYRLMATSTTISIQSGNFSGAWNNISGATFSYSVTSGDKIGLRCRGITIEAWIQYAGTGPWQRIISTTDATYPTGGQIGLGCASTMRLDDFSGGTLLGGELLFSNPFSQIQVADFSSDFLPTTTYTDIPGASTTITTTGDVTVFAIGMLRFQSTKTANAVFTDDVEAQFTVDGVAAGRKSKAAFITTGLVFNTNYFWDADLLPTVVTTFSKLTGAHTLQLQAKLNTATTSALAKILIGGGMMVFVAEY